MRYICLPFILTFLFTLPLACADQKAPELPALFERLETASLSSTEAYNVQQDIWRLWTEGSDEKADALMQQSIFSMRIGAYKQANDYLDRLIELYPNYSEAWNKRATLAFYQGDFDTSIADIQKTLALEPRHFGALAGLGMIYEALNDPNGAIPVYEAALKINPYMHDLRIRLEQLQNPLEQSPT